jgi:Restriction Enzyme Adenine Methylase Associated
MMYAYKQIIAANNPASKQKLIDIAAELFRNDPELQDLFADLGIHAIDIRQVLAEIVRSKPIIAMPIDAVKDDLRDWAETLKNPVKLWIVRKYVEFGLEENVMYEIPKEFGPVLITSTQEPEESQLTITRKNITIADLINAKLLSVGERLSMTYRPRSGTQQTFEATVCENGTILTLDKVFSNPNAALYWAVRARQ